MNNDFLDNLAQSLRDDKYENKLNYLPLEGREAIFGIIKNNDDEYKQDFIRRMTLASYYENRLGISYDEAFDGLDAFNEQYFKEKVDIKTAYQKLNENLNAAYFAKKKEVLQQTKYDMMSMTPGHIISHNEKELKEKAQKAKEFNYAVGAGAVGGAKFVSNVAVNLWATLNEIFARGDMPMFPGGPIIDNLSQEQKTAMQQGAAKTKKTVLQAVHDYYSEVHEGYTAGANIKPNWATDSDDPIEFADNFIKSMIMELPRQGLQLGLSAATGGMAAPILGVAYMLDKEAELLINNPEMSDGQRWANAFGTALINTLDTFADLKILKNVSNKELKATVLKRLSFVLSNMSIEGGTEYIQTLLENIVDIATGVYGDYKKMSGQEIWQLAQQNTTESGLVGSAFGGIKSTIDSNALAKRDAEAYRAKAELQNIAAEIRAKENPTDAEIAQLDQIERVIETNEPMAIIKAAEASQIIGQLQQNMQTESDEQLFEAVYGDEDAFFAAKADQVLQDQLVDQAFSPDIQHLKIALNDIQRKYPDVKIEMTQNYDTLSDTEKQYFDGRNYGKGMNGYYNDKTDTVVIFADNIQNTDHLEKTFAHETAGHKGLQVLLGNEYTSIIDEIYSAVNQKHSADLQELAATYGQDLDTIEGQRYIIEEYLANQADLKQLSGFKSFVQKIKLALRKVGFRAKWTDDEIATLMRRSLENVRKQRSATDNGGVRYAAALRKAGDPNNAALKNQLRSGNVPHITGFMEWAGLKGKNLYADYEFLYGRHSQYFNSPEEAKAAVELVLAKPEQVKDKDNNLSFVGFDEVTRDIFRIEINPEITGRANHIRSIFKITASQYNEIKLEPPRVLQPSSTALQEDGRKTMTISNFMDNKSQLPEKSSGNQEKMRFSIAPQVDTPEFKNWFGDSKVVDENGNPLVVYHGTNADFNIFDTEKFGAWDNGSKFRINGVDENGKLKIETIKDEGFFFSSIKRNAEGHADGAAEMTGGNPRVIAAYLKAEKPLIVEIDEFYADVKHYDAQDWYDHNTAEILDKYHAGNYDSIIIKNPVDKKDIMYIVFNPTQIKSATDNVGTFDPDNPDIRFSVSDGDGFVSTADREKMITVLMGIPQQQLDQMDGAAALDYLNQKRFNLPSEDLAQSLLNTARQRRKDIIKQFAVKRRKDWIMDNYPFYRALVELGGENAKVLLPKGEIYKNYSGSFIAHRKLKNGTAVPLKDIVEKIQQSGTDTKNLESKVLKFFDGLNISKLQQAYRDSMFDPASKTVQEHENYLLNKLSENKIFSEKEAAELQTLKEKYNALGLDLNIDNINIDTAQPAQTAEKFEPVTNLSADQKQQLAEEYKIKVQNIRSKYQSLAREAIEKQRTQLIEAYREQLAKIKDMVKNDRINLQAVQKQAAQFAREYLPKEQQSEFITGILNLGKYSNKTRSGELLTPRQKYLNTLLDDILDKSLKVAQNDNLAKLLKRLDQVHSRVNQSRRKVGTRDIDTQETLDQIVDISRMSDSLIAEKVDELKTQYETELNAGNDTADIEFELNLYKNFGNLAQKSANELISANKLLNKLEKEGRENLKKQVLDRRYKDLENVNYLVKTITRGKGALTGHAAENRAIELMESAWKKPKEELWKLLKLDDFIYILSAADKGKDYLTGPLGRIFVKVHDSEVNKQTELRKFSEMYMKSLDKALGSTNAVNRAEKLQELRKRIKNTGIYIYNIDTVRDIKYNVMTIEEARKELELYDEGKKNLNAYQAEFLRDRLDSLDVRMQKTYKREKYDGATELIMRELDKIEKDSKGEYIGVPALYLDEKIPSEWDNINQAQLLTLYLYARQRDARYKLLFSGFTEEAIAQAEKLLMPELKSLADDMVNYLSYLGDKLDIVSQNLFGAKIDRVENYFPLATRRIETDGKRIDAQQGVSELAPQQLSLGSLKKRNAHVQSLDIGDAIDIFHRHALKTIHYISWAETGRELRAVFTNKEAVNAMNQTFGTGFYQEFQNAIADTVNGGNIDIKDPQLLKTLLSNATSIKMMFNYLSGLKQIPSFIAYSQDVPVKAVFKGMQYAMLHPKEVYNVLNQTPYLRNRLESGPDIWARMVLDRANKFSSKYNAAVGVFNEWSSIFTRYGDLTAVMLGGYGVYKYHYDRMRKQGFDHDEANQYALKRFEMSTESLQQSGAVHNLNAWQRGGIATKTFTAWKSSQILNSQRQLREVIAAAYFGNNNENPFRHDVRRYEKYINDRIADGTLEKITSEAKKRLIKFYKDFPLGKIIKNKWGESLIFSPLEDERVDDYIQHFAVKRDRSGKENFSANYLELFPKIEETLKNPDERILTEVNGVPRVSFVKNVQTKNGNHLIVCSITPDGRIIFWTHMDSVENYIEKQRNLEKQAVSKYGLMDGNGNRVYMNYNKYLQQKAEIPLYLATAEAHQTGNLQAELSDRVINVTQKIKKSSADLINFYEGAEVSSSRAKFVAASLLKMIAISAFVKFIGDFAGGYGAFDDDEEDEDENNALKISSDYLMGTLGEQLSIFPVISDIAPLAISAFTDSSAFSSTDKYMFIDDIRKGLWAADKIINDEYDAEEVYDIMAQLMRSAGTINKSAGLVGSSMYQAKRLYDRLFEEKE